MSFLSDDFTSVGAGSNLTTSTAATWTKNTGSGENASFVGTAAGRIFNDGTGGGTAQYTASATPPSANYTVECDIDPVTIAGNSTGVMGRCNGSLNAFNGYALAYRPFHGCLLYRVDSGALTVLGTSNTGTTDPAAGTNIHLKLTVNGSTIQADVTGGMTGSWSTTDSTYSAAGLVGVYSNGGVSSTTGPHIDNVVATDLGGGGGGTTLVGTYYRRFIGRA